MDAFFNGQASEAALTQLVAQLIAGIGAILITGLAIIGLWVRRSLPKMLDTYSTVAQKAALIEAKRAEFELDRDKETLDQARIRDRMLTSLMDELSRDRKAHDQSLAERDQQIKKLSDALTQTTSKVQALGDQMIELSAKSEKTIAALEAQIVRLEAEIVGLRERLRKSEEENARLRAELAAKTAELEQLQQRIKTLEALETKS